MYSLLVYLSNRIINCSLDLHIFSLAFDSYKKYMYNSMLNTSFCFDFVQCSVESATTEPLPILLLTSCSIDNSEAFSCIKLGCMYNPSSLQNKSFVNKGLIDSFFDRTWWFHLQLYTHIFKSVKKVKNADFPLV